MRLFLFAFVAMFFMSCREEATTFTYCNPNLQMEFRDTHIVPYDGMYYAVGTCPPYWGGPNPGVMLYSSPDLLNWKQENMLIDTKNVPDTAWYKDRFWAPELKQIGSKFYLTFNCGNDGMDNSDGKPGKTHYHACGVAVADKITGPYTVMTPDEPLTPFCSNDITLFQDDDSKVYAVFNNGWTDIHRMYVSEFDTATCRLKDEPTELISQEPGTWDGGGIEGSVVFKRNGLYYLLYSSWTQGYAVGYATAKDIRGPWTKYDKNPVFGMYRNGDTTFMIHNGVDSVVETDLFNTGHNQIFEGPDGRYWLSYHAEKKDRVGAVTIIDPIWFEGDEIRTETPTLTPQTVTFTKKDIDRNIKNRK